MSMVLQSKTNGDYKPHPEGIHPAVCVDVIDLGLMEVEYKGQRKMVNKLRIVFESEQKLEDGRNCSISKNFTASLHPKAKLAEFLGKWRGRPVALGETIDLARLIGACCTIVVSHQQNMAGQTYAAIDAISKPTKRLTASGYYDPAAARQRIEEWKAKVTASQAYAAAPVAAPRATAASPQQQNGYSRPPHGQPPAAPAAQPAPKSVAAPAAAGAPHPKAPAAQPAANSEWPAMEYDPEVGF